MDGRRSGNGRRELCRRKNASEIRAAWNVKRLTRVDHMVRVLVGQVYEPPPPVRRGTRGRGRGRGGMGS